MFVPVDGRCLPSIVCVVTPDLNVFPSMRLVVVPEGGGGVIAGDDFVSNVRLRRRSVPSGTELDDFAGGPTLRVRSVLSGAEPADFESERESPRSARNREASPATIRGGAVLGATAAAGGVAICRGEKFRWSNRGDRSVPLEERIVGGGGEDEGVENLGPTSAARRDSGWRFILG